MIFWFRKTLFHHKIINKTRSTKNQENSAHRFGYNYLTNHLAKFLLDRMKPWRVGALKGRIHYEIFLSGHFMKCSFIVISWSMKYFHEILLRQYPKFIRVMFLINKKIVKDIVERPQRRYRAKLNWKGIV